MASRCVHVDRHIRLRPAQLPCARHGAQVFSKGTRVQRIAKFQEGRKRFERGLVETIEIREITRLVDLVDIGLLGGEVEVLADLVADGAEECWLDEGLDNAMCVAR